MSIDLLKEVGRLKEEKYALREELEGAIEQIRHYKGKAEEVLVKEIPEEYERKMEMLEREIELAKILDKQVQENMRQQKAKASEFAISQQLRIKELEVALEEQTVQQNRRIAEQEDRIQKLEKTLEERAAQQDRILTEHRNEVLRHKEEKVQQEEIIAEQEKKIKELEEALKEKGQLEVYHNTEEHLVSTAQQKNNLLNIKIRIEIKDKVKTLNAILDTGAAICVCDGQMIGQEFRRPSLMNAFIKGVNGITNVTEILEEGKMWIGNQWFRIPRTYVMPRLSEGLHFIIGMNFIRAMEGGIRIEKSLVTFYKMVTQTEAPSIVHDITLIEELEL